MSRSIMQSRGISIDPSGVFVLFGSGKEEMAHSVRMRVSNLDYASTQVPGWPHDVSENVRKCREASWNVRK